jgi:hypothetical protein
MLKWDIYKTLKPEEKEYYQFHFSHRAKTNLHGVTFNAILISLMCMFLLLGLLLLSFQGNLSDDLLNSSIRLVGILVQVSFWSILILGGIDIFTFIHRLVLEYKWYKSIGLKYSLKGWKNVI